MEIMLGCDKNNVSQDKQHQKAVTKILEKAGHNVQIMPVGPGATQNAMMKSSSKGKVVVFLVNGADLQTYKDFYQGMTKGYYHTKYCYFGLQGYINSRTCTCEGAKTVKLKKAHDDASSSSYTKDIVGMTTHEVMEKYKSKLAYACGSSVEELANNLVQVMGGETNSESNSSKQSTGSSIKEALKKAVAPWDGEIEIKLIGDTVYVNRIPNPSTTKLEINEYDNAIYDSINVTDINKNTVNNLSLTYKNKILNMKDDVLIKRFGTVSKKITAPKTVKSLNDAKDYLRREWNKIRREDGRTVECKVPGHTKWRGWVRVYLPSYFINDYMYISKTSHNEDSSGDWSTSLTLVDYPPSFGVEEVETSSKSNSESTDTSSDSTKSSSTSTSKSSSSSSGRSSSSSSGTKRRSYSKSTKNTRTSTNTNNTYRKRQLLG